LNRPIFITGIGTGVGKTLAAAVITEALQANYWKPIQAGLDEGTDTETVRSLISNTNSVIFPELYRLKTPASPHIAARMDTISIDVQAIKEKTKQLLLQSGQKPLLMEGAGGLLVPIADDWKIADLVKLLDAKLILVSRNYLGSINHSLLTAACCKANNLSVAGWIFTDEFGNYQDEIVEWSGYPSLGSIPKLGILDKATILHQANKLHDSLTGHLLLQP
jgi:dethiobiotin synthetase